MNFNEVLNIDNIGYNIPQVACVRCPCTTYLSYVLVVITQLKGRRLRYQLSVWRLLAVLAAYALAVAHASPYNIDALICLP